jgi:hypothetical protein
MNCVKQVAGNGDVGVGVASGTHCSDHTIFQLAGMKELIESILECN